MNGTWLGLLALFLFFGGMFLLIRHLRRRESDLLAVAAEELYESHPAGSDYDVDYEPSARFLSVAKAGQHVEGAVGPAGHALFGASRPTNAECWEYTGGDVPNKTQIEILNAYGRQGWEVILTKPNSTVTGAFDGTVYVLMKRKWFGLPPRNGGGRVHVENHEQSVPAPAWTRRPVRDNPQA